jgi:transposase-like protein
MNAARDDVPVLFHFPQEHWRKIWSIKPLERLNEEIKRSTNVVGIFPNDAAITRLVGSKLLKQRRNDSWSAGASFQGPPWSRSRNQKSLWSSPRVYAPMR